MLKKLAGQTAVYGIPSIVGRLINFLLVFLFTEYFKPEVFAAHVEFYAYAAFFLVLLPHGMETAFFNFLRKDEKLKSVFTTGMISVAVVGALFLLWAGLSRQGIADYLNYSDHPEYVSWFAFILLFDCLAMLPFALLRHLKKAGQFALIRSLGIILNVGFNVLYIVYMPQWVGEANTWYYNHEVGIGYVFIANLFASGAMTLMLLPQIIRHWGSPSLALWKRMWRYGWPLILVSLAGIVNETFDRAAMDKLLQTDNPKFDIGVYGAFYKLSIIITIFIQAFRYAAEPFFFEQSRDQDAKLVYARVMNYFVAVCLLIGLTTLLFLEVIAPIAVRRPEFFEHPDGLKVVAPLMLANVFLGILYNLSIWYKVQEKNLLGAYISGGGALLTIVLLVLFIPAYGFIAAAYTTLIVYGLMSVASYWLGQKYYPVPYEIGKLGILFVSAVLLYWIDLKFLTDFSTLSVVLKLGIVSCFSLIVFLVVIRTKKT